MAILRTLDYFFGSLDLAQKYARLFALDDVSLAARGLTREGLSQRYVEEFDALDAATDAPREAKGGVPAAA